MPWASWDRQIAKEEDQDKSSADIVLSSTTCVKCASRYAREDALSKLGQAVAEGAQLTEDFYHMLYDELQQPLLTQMHTHTALPPVGCTERPARSGATTQAS